MEFAIYVQITRVGETKLCCEDNRRTHCKQDLEAYDGVIFIYLI